MSKAITYYTVSCLLIVLSMLACNSEVSNSLEAKAVALGKMNEIVVIADDTVWESMVGDTFRYYFESPYPLMPTPEAMFDLRHYSGEEINAEPLRKELRTYAILVDLNDLDSPVTKMARKDMGEEKFTRALKENKPGNSIGKNKWAQGQMLIYLYANGHDSLAELIRASYPAIAKKVHKHDRNQLEAQVYGVPVNHGLSEKIKEDYGMEMKIPVNYKIAKEELDGNFIWLRKDGKKGVMNIVLKKLPYSGKEQFDKDYIKGVKNEFGKSYVTSDTEGSYLRVHEEQVPIYEYTQDINGMYTKELRGVWEMTGDFMGGPFVSYMIHNSANEELLFVDAFVFAPGQAKRNMIQELDFIVKNMKI